MRVSCKIPQSNTVSVLSPTGYVIIGSGARSRTSIVVSVNDRGRGPGLNVNILNLRRVAQVTLVEFDRLVPETTL